MDKMDITLTGLTDLQVTIADLLWDIDDEEDIEAVCKLFPKSDVEIVKTLMIAAALDMEDGTELAAQALRGIGL